jgi:hypothetical protein
MASPAHVKYSRQLRFRIFVADILANQRRCVADEYLYAALQSKAMLVRLSAASAMVKAGRREDLLRYLKRLIREGGRLVRHNAITTTARIGEIDLFFEEADEFEFSSILDDEFGYYSWAKEGEIFFPNVRRELKSFFYLPAIGIYYQQQLDVFLARVTGAVQDGRIRVSDNFSEMRKITEAIISSVRLRHTGDFPLCLKQKADIVRSSIQSRVVWGLCHPDPKVRIMFIWLNDQCRGASGLVRELLDDPVPAVRRHARAVLTDD